jgi:hypothetical protein
MCLDADKLKKQQDVDAKKGKFLVDFKLIIEKFLTLTFKNYC